MLSGIGTDIVEISRIRTKLEGNKSLQEHMFSANEIAYCQQKKNPYESFAIRFAAKEALLKALGRGLNLTLHLNQIEIVRNSEGCPFIALHPDLTNRIPNYTQLRFHVSMSHSENYASAIVVVEQIM